MAMTPEASAKIIEINSLDAELLKTQKNISERFKSDFIGVFDCSDEEGLVRVKENFKRSLSDLKRLAERLMWLIDDYEPSDEDERSILKKQKQKYQGISGLCENSFEYYIHSVFHQPKTCQDFQKETAMLCALKYDAPITELKNILGILKMHVDLFKKKQKLDRRIAAGETYVDRYYPSWADLALFTASCYLLSAPESYAVARFSVRFSLFQLGTRCGDDRLLTEEAIKQGVLEHGIRLLLKLLQQAETPKALLIVLSDENRALETAYESLRLSTRFRGMADVAAEAIVPTAGLPSLFWNVAGRWSAREGLSQAGRRVSEWLIKRNLPSGEELEAALRP